MGDGVRYRLEFLLLQKQTVNLAAQDALARGGEFSCDYTGEHWDIDFEIEQLLAKLESGGVADRKAGQ